MNFSQFYENIILRDVIEYFTPGFLFLAGIALLFVSLMNKMGIDISPIVQTASTFMTAILAVVVVIAYVLGHLIAGISDLFFRKYEDEQAIQVLTKDNWLKLQVAKMVSEYFGVPLAEANEMLADASTASSIREIARVVAQHRMPEIQKEFVIRLSILSRFCQNMAVVIWGIMLSSILVLIIELGNNLSIQPLIASFLLALGIIISYIFLRRAGQLRFNMIRFTFQIWYVDYLETVQKKNNSARDEKGNWRSIVKMLFS
ncbi:MAG: hypothetical protein WA821_19300 [Anaerolineales bacterium]